MTMVTDALKAIYDKKFFKFFRMAAISKPLAKTKDNILASSVGMRVVGRE
jgi:hypothetical protein